MKSPVTGSGEPRPTAAPVGPEAAMPSATAPVEPPPVPAPPAPDSEHPDSLPVTFAGVPSVVPRPVTELGPLLDWLRAGRPAGERLDFAVGTALPDGRLDLCKQELGAEGAALVAEALGQGPVPCTALAARHRRARGRGGRGRRRGER
ncbi:hypothetical protein [Streptomyces sp. MBT65]|uniref:hypothetical protein n=1 Tax=Streptomyces sp. MBT65 TaxID=1488395 RepID=UPI001F48AFD1|nr:hypothetical protein [Streptomyces sp. MBT65]